MNIAVIPARAGSKRIPGKNLRPFCGVPVISRSIRCAIESEIFDHVVVSTDSQEIADLAIQEGATVPFRRPATLADDHTPTVPVIQHAIQSLQSQHDQPVQSVCCIYATAPFIRKEDLITGYQWLVDGQWEFVFPVTTFDFPVFRALQFETDHQVKTMWPEYELTRSQDLPEAVHDAGQFYWGTGAAWLKHERIYSARSAGLPIPRYRVQDLDTEEDWQRAEAMFQALNRQSSGGC